MGSYSSSLLFGLSVAAPPAVIPGNENTVVVTSLGALWVVSAPAGALLLLLLMLLSLLLLVVVTRSLPRRSGVADVK